MAKTVAIEYEDDGLKFKPTVPLFKSEKKCLCSEVPQGTVEKKKKRLEALLYGVSKGTWLDIRSIVNDWDNERIIFAP